MAEPEEAEDELAARRRLRDAVAKLDEEAAEAKKRRPILRLRAAQLAQITKILILVVALVAIVAFREQCGQGVVNLFNQLAPPP